MPDLVGRLKALLIEECVKSGMPQKVAEENVPVALNKNIVECVRECITLARDTPARTPPRTPPKDEGPPSK